MADSRNVLPGAAPRGVPTPVGRPTAGWLLRVDPVACDGVGICSHLAPGLINVDSWGYPVLPAHGLTDRELKRAQSAVNGCPRKALFLQPPPVR
jgi:ferredoxin